MTTNPNDFEARFNLFNTEGFSTTELKELNEKWAELYPEEEPDDDLVQLRQETLLEDYSCGPNRVKTPSVSPLPAVH